MFDIFKDERRGSGLLGPDPTGTGRIFARLNSYGAASRQAYAGPPPPRLPLLTLAKIRSRHGGELYVYRP